MYIRVEITEWTIRMIRFNFFIDQQTIDKLRKNMRKYGHASVGSFLRYIIIKFFERSDK